MKELDFVAEIAFNYGFTPIITPKITDDDKAKAKLWKMFDTHAGESEERLALMRLFDNLAFTDIAQPPMLYMKRPFPGSEARKKSNFLSCQLEILNVSKAAAEAIIMKTAWTILLDCGCKDMKIEINSIGDKESFAKFERELHVYFRKNMHNLSGELIQKFKENNLSILSPAEKKDDLFRAEAPKSISSMSESSRDHFKEVLEFLECLSLPYQINDSLMPNKHYASDTVFEIKGVTEKSGQEILLCAGGRYNYLARRAEYKKDVPAVGASIFYPKKAVLKKRRRKILFEKIKPARFYLVQLGHLAKFQTLGIVEMLRQENIPVYHSLVKENIGGQLASAEYLKVSHLLIIGQKEAIENSVAVRSTDLRVQETVKVDELSDYLKRIMRDH